MGLLEVFESILKKKQGGSGAGPSPDILQDILRGGAARRGPSASGGGGPSTNDITREAQDLERQLGVGGGPPSRSAEPPRQSPRPTGQSPRPTPPGPRQTPLGPRPTPPGRPTPPSRDDFGFGQDITVGQAEAEPTIDGRRREEAIVLVRAMLNAAKADGQISQAEQQSILQQLDGESREILQLLRDELNRPVDVREFAWSVPLGMEEQVYAVSRLAIDVDSTREQQYLRDLAHGLRLRPETCEQIEQRIGGGRR